MPFAHRRGRVAFFVASMSGQNNTLLERHGELVKVAARGGAGGLERRRLEVEAVTIDGFVAEHGAVPDLRKIDVEGAELLVLRDMRTTLATVRPLILVQVTETEEAGCARLEAAGCRPFEATPATARRGPPYRQQVRPAR